MEIKVEGYAFTTHPMPLFLRELAEDYIERNLNKTIFQYKNNFYDIKTLNNLTNLDCMNCHLAHTKLCCEGPPYPLLEEDKINIKEKVNDIFSKTLEQKELLAKLQLIKENGLFDQEGTFIEDCGNCLFFNNIEAEGGPKGCSIHLYSLKQQQDYTDIKPSSCLMYPLDVLTLNNGGYFVFGIDSETVVNIYSREINGNLEYAVTPGNLGFSRWNQNDLDYLCVNIHKRRNIEVEMKNPLYKSNIPNDIYLEQNYHPLFEEEEKILKKFFGNESYSFIKQKTNEMFTMN